MSLEMKYFVLKPKGTGPHATASRKAMLTYSREIADEDVELAESLIEWAQRETDLAIVEKMRDEQP